MEISRDDFTTPLGVDFGVGGFGYGRGSRLCGLLAAVSFGTERLWELGLHGLASIYESHGVGQFVSAFSSRLAGDLSSQYAVEESLDSL